MEVDLGAQERENIERTKDLFTHKEIIANLYIFLKGCLTSNMKSEFGGNLAPKFPYRSCTDFLAGLKL